MTPTGKKRDPKRPTLMEGLNNVPKILKEARRAVDEATQPEGSQNLSNPGPPAAKGRKRPQEASPAAGKKSPKKEVQSQKKAGKKPATRKKTAPKKPEPRKPAEPPAMSVSEARQAPSQSMAYYGIRVRHHIPGRIRLHVRKIKYNQVFADRIQTRLAGLRGIAAVEASPATGSLLVLFDPQELANSQSRRDFANLMEGFFPGLDTEPLLRKIL